VKLLNDKTSLQVLQILSEKCNFGEDMKLELKRDNHVYKKIRTSMEFRLNANIGYFIIGDIILDLGSEVNVLPKKTWEDMGELALRYSPIQLKIENQHRVVPIGIFKGIPTDLYGVCTMDDFEVIDIVYKTSPYTTLLGLDWNFDNRSIINLKTRKMIFGSVQYRVIAPLDPLEGEIYVELVT
jgi:hypothetical protein